MNRPFENRLITPFARSDHEHGGNKLDGNAGNPLGPFFFLANPRFNPFPLEDRGLTLYEHICQSTLSCRHAQLLIAHARHGKDKV